MLEHPKPDELGYIVAWHSKHEHRAGRFTEALLTYGDATAKAEKLARQYPENTYWTEHSPGGGAH